MPGNGVCSLHLPFASPVYVRWLRKRMPQARRGFRNFQHCPQAGAAALPIRGGTQPSAPFRPPSPRNMSEEAKTSSAAAEPKLCKMGCGFFVSRLVGVVVGLFKIFLRAGHAGVAGAEATAALGSCPRG